MTEIQHNHAHDLQQRLELVRIKRDELQADKEKLLKQVQSLSMENNILRSHLKTSTEVIADIKEAAKPIQQIMDRGEGCINHAWPWIEDYPQDLAPSTYEPGMPVMEGA